MKNEEWNNIDIFIIMYISNECFDKNNSTDIKMIEL
jgi:hypothetical protein